MPDPVVMPKYVEKIIEVPVFVEKRIEVEKPVLVEKRIEVERPVAKDKVYERPVLKDVVYERPVLKDKEYAIPRIVTDDTLLAVRAEDMARLRQAVELLPVILAKLEQIVRWEPRIEEIHVQKPVLVPVEIIVDRPKFTDVKVERPVYVDVQYEKPVIREQVIIVKRLAVRNDAGELESVGYAKD